MRVILKDYFDTKIFSYVFAFCCKLGYRGKDLEGLCPGDGGI